MPRRRFARQAAPALLVLLTFGVTMHAEVPALLAPFQFFLANGKASAIRRERPADSLSSLARRVE
jgi:hypothetical protein